MKLLRTALFWMHLVAGVAAGLVILLMSVTGVSLTYEKQMLEWADRRQAQVVAPSAEARPLPPGTLLASATAARPGAVPTGLTRRADPGAPATVTFEGGRAVLVDPYRGVVLGEPAPELRGFFRTMTNWHRWLALDGASRSTGRLVTGAANLGFLFLVLSGFYLWLPRLWTRRQFGQILWFRGGLPAKAREFNWHNVIGFWSAIPLALVVAGAVPISFPWASDLVYRLSGEVPPARPLLAARPGRVGGPVGTARGVGFPDSHADAGHAAPPVVDLAGLDPAWATAESQVPEWRSMNVRLARTPTAPFVIALDQGYGGQPQGRTTLTIDPASGTLLKSETFSDLGAGRRARSWLRFAHTGEYLRSGRSDHRGPRVRRRSGARLHRHRPRAAPTVGVVATAAVLRRRVSSRVGRAASSSAAARRPSSRDHLTEFWFHESSIALTYASRRRRSVRAAAHRQRFAGCRGDPLAIGAGLGFTAANAVPSARPGRRLPRRRNRRSTSACHLRSRWGAVIDRDEPPG